MASTLQHGEGQKPKKIVIVGGSITGLMTGILLKRQGYNIHILESATSSQREGTAAGIGLSAEVQRFFDQNDRLKDILPLGAINEKLELVDKEGNALQSVPLGSRMTTWEAAYHRLRANFDNLESTFCPAPLPGPDASEGEGEFETGVRVLLVEEQSDRLVVHVEDVSTKLQRQIDADAVIAADGANSTIRRQVSPDTVDDEPGYVIWRGTVPTAALPQDVVEKFENRTVIHRMEHNYVMLYTIPGQNGTCARGSRSINFVWYTWPSPSPSNPHTNTSIHSILTDKTNHTHRKTLPKGLMRPETWSAQLTLAKQTFPSPLHAVTSAISEPFVSLISATTNVSKAAYMHDRLFILGDALFQPRPNTGFGVNCCAVGAVSLGEVFAGRLGVREWEGAIVRFAGRERARAVAFSGQFLYGWVAALWVKWLYWLTCSWAEWACWWQGMGMGRRDEEVLGLTPMTWKRWKERRLQ